MAQVLRHAKTDTPDAPAMLYVTVLSWIATPREQCMINRTNGKMCFCPLPNIVLHLQRTMTAKKFSSTERRDVMENANQKPSAYVQQDTLPIPVAETSMVASNVQLGLRKHIPAKHIIQKYALQTARVMLVNFANACWTPQRMRSIM
tara:strand:+ start:126 stop:566 length:441 start_codon:yes stop_codon:yes gene_type:complete